ncbi:MAG: saccharopine dehydrogenase NADP-binding domain-containing protein [Bacteroidota bacterium]|nr:saccharopine dehydrogenase NADP-binding domain-containing protein [Bacteroidota bacterium]
MKIAVLGSGMVGRAIALDLATSFQITSFDVSAENLKILKQRNAAIETKQVDLKAYHQYEEMLKDFGLIVTAVPGFMGFDTLQTVISCGKNVADISFFPEDALQLHELAKQKNVTVITDIGVAPGISNLFIGRYNEEMQISNFEFYVGGLPKIRKKPFEYKAPFSPVDVIEEYTRPARLKENGFIVSKDALTERKFLQFETIGTLEAFNTDGLRSILFTMPHIPNIKEQTLRYPGHIDLIIALKEAGFFDHEEISINNSSISPLQFTSKILFNDWKLGLEEEELTVMRIIIEGRKNDAPVREEFNMVDRYDPVTKISSMSRTTGYTCTAAVHLIAQKLFTEKGVYPPELVGKYKTCFDFVLNHLKERNISIIKK